MNVSKKKGQSLVEFALCFPLLIVILANVLELGFLFYKENVLAAATREGTLFAIRLSNSDESWNSNKNVNEYRVRQLVLGLGSGTGLSSEEISIECVNEDAALANKDTIAVTIKHVHRFFTPFNFLGRETMDISRSWKAIFVANQSGTRT